MTFMEFHKWSMEFHKSFMEFHKSFMEFHKCSDLWNSINDLWNSINDLWNSINHLWNSINAYLRALRLAILHWLVRCQEKRILFYWIPSHIGIKGNEKADSALKAGLLRRVTNVPISFGDFKKHIYVLMKHKWQAEWDGATNNKLHTIHPQLGLWLGGFRFVRPVEGFLARIRIGHSHLTHALLLEKEDPPQCLKCKKM